MATPTRDNKWVASILVAADHRSSCVDMAVSVYFTRDDRWSGVERTPRTGKKNSVAMLNCPEHRVILGISGPVYGRTSIINRSVT
jgi:hypothetical protein